MQSKNFDPTDLQILAALQADGRLSSADLAERVSLTPSPCWRRVKRLEDEGVIRGYRAEVDVKKLGFGVTAFVWISLDMKGAEHVKRSRTPSGRYRKCSPATASRAATTIS